MPVSRSVHRLTHDAARLPLEFLGVGVGAMLVADLVDAALDRAIEQCRWLIGGVGDQFVGECGEVGAFFVGQRLGVMRQRVQMRSGDCSRGQRLLELGQITAHPVAAVGVLGVGAGAPPLVDQRVGGGRVALGRQLSPPTGDLHLGEVDERLQPGHGPSGVGEFGMVGHGQVGLNQRLHRRAHPCVVHAPILVEGCDRVSNACSTRSRCHRWWNGDAEAELGAVRREQCASMEGWR